jgi:hypothetical protein
MNIIKTLILAVAVAASALAHADTANGVTSRIEATTDSYTTRVALVGVAAMCSGGPDWGYVSSTDTGYQTITATLLTAHATGLSVTIYSSLNGSGCKITNATLRNY